MTDDSLAVVEGMPLDPSFLTSIRFETLDIPEEIKAGLRDTGYAFCTPIQAKTLPLSLEGKDVAGQAQTGTGKTAAFLVTIFARMAGMADRKPLKPSALIVAPTRELAGQIFEEAGQIGRHTGYRITQIIGGIDYRKQADILKEGSDIVICTPGRIIDYLKQGIFKTRDIRTLVIDEADRLFDLGFTKDMRYILRKLPYYDRRQTMLFSATLSYRVMELTYEYMNLPEVISVTPEQLTVEAVEQSLVHVGKNEKLRLLLGLLEKEEWSRVLIFLNTKAGVEWLTEKLKGNGYPVEGITGDLPQKQRLRLMKDFKKGDIKILLATDVASRGIHVEDISHVFNYDLPQDSENYVHRIGRTARAGKTGRAISLACEEYVYHLEALENMLGYKIPTFWPEDEWYKEDRCGRVERRRRPQNRGQAGGGRGKPRGRPGGPKKAETRARASEKGRPGKKRGEGSKTTGKQGRKGERSPAAPENV